MENASIRDFGEIIGSMLYKVEIKLFLQEKKINQGNENKRWKMSSHGKCMLLYYVQTKMELSLP